METLQRWLANINNWIRVHWRITVLTLLFIIMMQQCTINRLYREMAYVASQQSSQPTLVTAQDSLAQDTLAQDTLTISTNEVAQPEVGDVEDRGMVWPIVLIAIILLSSIFVFLRRKGVWPFGLWVSGKLHQEMGGDIYFDLKVNNPSRRVVEISDPIVNFTMRAGVRKFRAAVQNMPLTLQPGTSFSTTIKLTGLIQNNVELTNSKAISLSVMCNKTKRTTIPQPIKFKTA